MGSNELGQLGIESSTALPEDAIEGMPIPASVEPFNVWTVPKRVHEGAWRSWSGARAPWGSATGAAARRKAGARSRRRGGGGYMHTLARTASGRIYGWGNGEGRLGHGDEDDRVEPMGGRFPGPQGGPVSGSDLV